MAFPDGCGAAALSNAFQPSHNGKDWLTTGRSRAFVDECGAPGVTNRPTRGIIGYEAPRKAPPTCR
jgi:hypothetical protein